MFYFEYQKIRKIGIKHYEKAKNYEYKIWLNKRKLFK
jgi:hypothetical protein